jgi:enoyl-CoA hydratase
LITAAQAREIGLVNRVLPPQDLGAACLETAQRMAGMGKVSLRAAKVTVNRGLEVDLNSGCAMEIDAFALCMASPDGKEGTTAFMEKRKADFKGALNR